MPPKPSQAVIDARQAAKKIKREAAAAAGHPLPAPTPAASPKVVSGKPYVPKEGKQPSTKRIARKAERGARKAALGKKEPFVLGLP